MTELSNGKGIEKPRWCDPQQSQTLVLTKVWIRRCCWRSVITWDLNPPWRDTEKRPLWEFPTCSISFWGIRREESVVTNTNFFLKYWRFLFSVGDTFFQKHYLTKCKCMRKVCQLYISCLSGFRIPLSASPSIPAVGDHTIVTLTGVSEDSEIHHATWKVVISQALLKKFLNH